MIDLNSDMDSESRQLMLGLAGGKDPHAIMEAMSPVNYVLPGKAYPPFFLLHGDADKLVPYEQSLEMLQTLQAAGIDARMARVHGAPHEGSFWSEAAGGGNLPLYPRKTVTPFKRTGSRVHFTGTGFL